MRASFAFLIASLAHAQNLVPNGSFEEYVDCPPSFSFINWAVGWSGYSNSVDYFDTCASSVVDVPLNDIGYQYAASGGGYAGVVTYILGDPFYREILGCHLTMPLQPGVPVCLRFKVAMGGFGSNPANSATYTCRGVGMRFLTFDPSMESVTNNLLNSNIAALHLDVVPTDTSIWYTVSGTYVPDSAYSVLLIGNFFNDSLSTPMLFDSVYGTDHFAYVFIDDVRVSYDVGFCDLPDHVSPLEKDRPAVWPNPFRDFLTITLANTSRNPVSIELFSVDGRSVAHWSVAATSAISLDTEELKPGSYILQVRNAEGSYPAIHVVRLSP